MLERRCSCREFGRKNRGSCRGRRGRCRYAEGGNWLQSSERWSKSWGSGSRDSFVCDGVRWPVSEVARCSPAKKCWPYRAAKLSDNTGITIGHDLFRLQRYRYPTSTPPYNSSNSINYSCCFQFPFPWLSQSRNVVLLKCHLFIQPPVSQGPAATSPGGCLAGITAFFLARQNTAICVWWQVEGGQ